MDGVAALDELNEAMETGGLEIVVEDTPIGVKLGADIGGEGSMLDEGSDFLNDEKMKAYWNHEDAIKVVEEQYMDELEEMYEGGDSDDLDLGERERESLDRFAEQTITDYERGG